MEYKKLEENKQDKKVMRGFAIIMLCIEIVFTAEEAVSLCRGRIEAADLIIYGIFTAAVTALLITVYAMMTTCAEYNVGGIRQTVFEKRRKTVHEYSWDEFAYVGRAYVRGDGRTPSAWYVVCSASMPEYEYRGSKACTFSSKKTVYIEDTPANADALKAFFKP